MIFYYIRHGDPVYNINTLTPLGYQQASALSKRFLIYGLDEIYSSPSERAILTARPTCELLKKDMKLLEWTNEDLAWKELTCDVPGGRNWCFQDKKHIEKFHNLKGDSLEKWCENDLFRETNLKNGITRIDKEVDDFFLSLGFEHDREKARYRVIEQNKKRIALFAHQGFGLAFLSSLLDIPYPIFCTRFDLGHSSVTVINFEDTSEYTYPKILQLSDNSHCYKEGILAPYQNKIRI